MTGALASGLLVAAAIGCGTIGGVFFAFSSFVMPALGRRPAAEGMAAMQAINVTVLNVGFLGVFFGTAAACAALAAAVLADAGGPGSAAALTGCALYLLGSFGVTIAFNVPLNRALAAASPDEADSTRIWQRYLAVWTRWNHVRTAASLAALLALILAR